MKPLSRVPLLAASSLLFLSPNIFATVRTWDASNGTDWNTINTSWTGTTWNNTTSDQAIFGATGAGTINLTTGITANKLTFNAGGYTIAGNTLTLSGTTPAILNSAGANAINSNITLGAATTITNSDSSNALSLGGTIAKGTNLLTITGAGATNLTGGLTGTGGLYVDSAGTFTYSATGGTTNDFQVGRGANGNFKITGGDLTVSGGSDILFCQGGTTSTITQTGGTLTLGTSFFKGANGAGQTGTVDVSGGGIWSQTGTFMTNQRGIGILNLSGSSTSMTVGLLALGGWVGDAKTATVNLNGGVLSVSAVSEQSGSANAQAANGGTTSTLNFAGGTLTATASNTTFMTNVDTVNVKDGGAKIDTNGKDVTIAKALGHFAGATTDSLTKSGSGILTLSGGSTYTGATTIANGTLSTSSIVVSTGSSGLGNASSAVVLGDATNQGILSYTGNTATYLRGLTINAGGGRIDATTSGQTLTIGTGNITGSGPLTIGGAANTTINSSVQTASLTKVDAGTLVLSGANTYSGTTTLTSGKLYLNNTNSTGGINVAAGKTLGGSGSAAFATATIASTGILDAGYGGSGSLGLAGLTFGGSGTINIATVGNYLSNAAISTTANNGLTVSGAANSVTLKLSGVAPVGTGSAHLIQYAGTIQGTGFSAFTLDTSAMTGLGARSVVSLSNPTGYVDLSYSVDHPVWTGALDGIWALATQGAPKNWVLATNPLSITDYILNDAVEFADGAANFTVTINGTAVSPQGVTFSNASQDYILQGTSGIAGATSLIKNAAGSLTINNANTYTGGTILSVGTLRISNGAALGTGALTITGGTLDSGSALTIANNNAQNWNGDFSFAGTNNLNLGSGAVTLGASPTVTVQAGTLTVGGIISGAYGLAKSGSGTLVLTGGNLHTGGTTLNGGTLSFANGALGSSGAITLNGGALQWNGSNTQDVSSRLTMVAATTATFDTNGQNVTLASAIGSGNSSSLTKIGAGTLTLSGDNTYTGTTTVNAGTLVFRTPNFNTYRGGQININNGSTVKIEDGGGVHRYDFATQTYNFDANGGGTITTVGANMNWVAQGTWTFKTNGGAKNIIIGDARMNLNAKSVVLDVAAGTNGTSDLDIGIDVGNTTGGLTKTGAGTVTLTAANSFSGAAQVNSGKLIVTGSLAAGGALTVGGATASGSPTLGGTGTINRATVIAAAGGGAAGIHAPAAQASGSGQTFTSTLNYGTGSIFEWDLNAANADTGATNQGNYGQVKANGATGSVTGGAAVFKVVLGSNTFADAFWDTDKSWSNIFSGAGAPATLASLFSAFDASGGLDSSGTVAGQGQFTMTSSTLTWSAVPEPTGALAAVVLGAGLLRRRRK